MRTMDIDLDFYVLTMLWLVLISLVIFQIGHELLCITREVRAFRRLKDDKNKNPRQSSS